MVTLCYGPNIFYCRYLTSNLSNSSLVSCLFKIGCISYMPWVWEWGHALLLSTVFYYNQTNGKDLKDVWWRIRKIPYFLCPSPLAPLLPSLFLLPSPSAPFSPYYTFNIQTQVLSATGSVQLYRHMAEPVSRPLSSGRSVHPCGLWR